MRVAFVQKDPMPHPDLMVLGASLTFRGHEAAVFIPAAERNLEEAVRRWAPAVVVFSPATGFHDWAFEQARRLGPAAGRAPRVFTGSHATDHPEIARVEGVDLVMVGDPETTLPELLLKIAKERALPGTTGTVAADEDGQLVEGPPRRIVDNLDELPLADMEIYRRYRFVRKQSTLSFCTGRGVMENTHAGFRIGLKELMRRFRPARRHSAAEAIQRLHLHSKRRAVHRRIAFRDDSLLMDGEVSPWLEELMDRYRRELGLPFSCMARPDQLDGAVIELLAESGCDLVRLGIESGDEALRESVAGVPISDERVREAVAALRRAGIRVQTLAFLGLPGETRETATRTLDMCCELRPDHAFAIGVQGGDSTPEIEGLRQVLPLVAGRPALRGPALRAVDQGRERLLSTLFQLNHDAAFLRSGELARVDILRIATAMRRSRNG